MEDLNLPEIKRKKLEKKEEDKKEFKDLFDSDSDSEDGGAGLSLKKGNFISLGLPFLRFLQRWGLPLQQIYVYV